MFDNYEAIGNPNKNLLIKGKGNVKIQWGSKFIDLIKDGQINTGGQKVNTVNTITDIGKIDGFYYVKENSSVYLIINSEKVPIVDGDNSSYVSYLEQNNLNETKRLQALKNIGFIFQTKAELANLKFENSIVYCQEDGQLYIIDNGAVTKFSTTITEHTIHADDADKLTSTRKIWGQNFNGTKDIIGDQEVQGNSNILRNQKIYGNSEIKGTLTVGNFSEGTLGAGAIIRGDGSMEVDSIYARKSISAPEFTFNKITVNYGETWCTNGYGTVKEVDTENCVVYLDLPDGEFISVEEGDLCKGIYHDDSLIYAQENHLDNQGFEVKDFLFSSYFQILKVADSSFKYKLQEGTTKHPCPHMKFAQYGNASFQFTDAQNNTVVHAENTKRQSSQYTTTINHAYTMYLENVNTFEIKPDNIVKIDGYLEGRTVNIIDSNGNHSQLILHGNGLFVKNNVYFGGALIQFNADTYKNIQEEINSRIVNIEVDPSYKCLNDVLQYIDIDTTINGETHSVIEVTVDSNAFVSYILDNDVPKLKINIGKGTEVRQTTIGYIITYTENNVTYSKPEYITLTPSVKGVVGIYDAGVYDSTKTYTNNGEWAPLVKYNEQYYYLNYVGSVVKSPIEPVSENVIQNIDISNILYWKPTSRADALYASILMSDFATLNSAVFKGDYMFSKQGTSSTSGTYLDFDPTDLTKFTPNFYVDFNTGKVKCSNIEVTGGTFSIGDNFSVDYSGNLVAQNATLSGDITANKVSAATGSFSSLACVNSSGSSNIGTLQFGNNGALWWSGDLYMNGSRTIGSNTRSLRFFAQDLWCRGSFGSIARNLVKIVGNTAYYYSFGTDSTEHLNVYTTVNLESKITSAGETYYNIPCYGNSYFQDASGMPIDTVVFATPNTDTTTYNYNIQLFCSQRVTLFNACDDKGANIYIRGDNFEIKGGYVIILQNFKTFLINETTGTVGEGHVLFLNTDNNWSH